MKCRRCQEDAIDIGPRALREWCGALAPKVIAAELSGPRYCYECLKGQVISVVLREYRANERRPNRRPWGGHKG